MTPLWPSSAKEALAYLFRPLQDVDVYVEDTNDTVFYTELLQRIKPDNVRLVRVFEAGNRNGVIEKAKAHDFAVRRALFLVDGDLEWVRGEKPPAPDRVYRLDAYCIENLLIHEDAAVQIVVEEAAILEEAARQALRFADWIKGTVEMLLELFVWFAALNLVKPSEPTVGLGVGKLLLSKKGKGPVLDPAKIEDLTRKMRQATEQEIGASRAKELGASISDRVNSLPTQSDVISGKDYLLPLFEYRLWSCTRRKTRRESLRVRLARHCSLERLGPLRAAMANSVKRG